jgi:hypothetical protein
VTRADKAKQFRSLRHLPLPTNPILPRDLERRPSVRPDGIVEISRRPIRVKEQGL